MGARSLLLVLISLSILYKTNKLSIVSFGIIYTKINNKTQDTAVKKIQIKLTMLKLESSSPPPQNKKK